MLGDFDVQPMLPVKDLDVAKRFYERTLGLEKIGEEPGVAVTYRSGRTTLHVYRSGFAGSNEGTAAMWEVKDVEQTVMGLKAKGATFEQYDNMPGLTRQGDIHSAGEFRVAWFKDPDGNILSVQNRPARDQHG